MSAVAEKQTRAAVPQRRAVARAIAAWSRAPASERSALRSIVDVSQTHAKPDSAPGGAEPAAQRACAGCGDEMELQRLALESSEDEHEEQVQRKGEAPSFADAADEDEAPLPPASPPRPGSAITVGPADDEHEREADDVAQRVMRKDTPATERAKLPGQDEEQGEQRLRSKRRGVGREGGDIEDPELAARLHAPAGGRPLSDALRAFIEPQLPYDFSGVRVHDSAADARDAARINARAFTYGKHIWIGAGESADNPRLMAHELTHVVQQGGARRVVQRDEADEAAEPGFLARMALGLVRRYAPRLEPVLRRGPLNWLKDQLMSAFDGLVGAVNRLNPAAALAQLTGVFEGLIARAEPIVTALRSGNCEPLFQAIADLKSFVTEVAGAAWDGLVNFLRPIGEFFTDLWNGYGAPAIEWLQEFAGDVWDGIRELGAYIWDSTAGVRAAIGGAWGWVKEQLFGPEEDSAGDSQGGIVAWIQRKAMAAWDEIKALTRPVWQPVVQAAEKIRELIPPPFVRRLGEQFRQLSASLNQANQEMSGGDDVAENRDALAAALPTVQEVIVGVRGIIVTAGAWLQEKVGAVTGDVTALLARLRGHSLLRPLGTLLGWLDGAARDLGAWARQKVSGLFELILRGFDFLAPFVQRLVTVVRNVISVAGDLLQLPSLVLNAVWNLIPACIRNPIRDFIVNQILSRIPVFSTLMQLGDIWSRVEAIALRILRQVFVDGNLARAAWTFFSSVLEALGIPPQLVVGILAKAASAIGSILSDPVGFLINLLSAIKEGFIRFFDNIGTHLLGGVTGWLFGQLTRGGLQPPADFSLRSILGFVLQVLDITVDRVFERLARRIDPAIVQRLRQALEFATGVWRFVSILIEEGPAGLWAEIQEQLGGLWNRVLDGVIGWLTRTVITRVSARLLTMLDPTGVMAVVNSLIALYRAIQSAVEYLREMLMIVDRVLDGINGIANGAIDIAAGFLETALASGIPVAIGFLANQIGLRDFGERIQEMVESVREMVDRAIDWVIDRAIAGGQALLSMLRGGGRAAGAAAGAPPDVASMTPEQRKEGAKGRVEQALQDGERGSDLTALLLQVKNDYHLADARLDLSDGAHPRIVYTASPDTETALTSPSLGTAAGAAAPAAPAPTAPSINFPEESNELTPYGAVKATYLDNTVEGAFQVQERSWRRPRRANAVLVGARPGGGLARPAVIAASGHVGNDEHRLATGSRPLRGYDGGHLVGLQLAGPATNTESNLAPQHPSFNRGIYVQIENMVARSPVAGSPPAPNFAVPIQMDVQISYSSPTRPITYQQLLAAGAIAGAARDHGNVAVPTRVPSRWRMHLEVSGPGHVLSEHEPGAGTLGAERSRGEAPAGSSLLAAGESFIWYKVGAARVPSAPPSVGGSATETIEAEQATP